MISIERVPETIGEEPEQISAGGLGGNPLATAFKQPERLVYPHEQGHIEISTRVARAVEEFANEAFGSLDLAALTKKERAELQKILIITADEVAERVNEDFYHSTVTASSPAEIDDKVSRVQDLLSNNELERAVREELVKAVQQNSRKLGKFLK